jgi:hypothetical protein
MTITDERIDRLEQALARLEALGTVLERPSTMAAPTDAYGNPGASLLPGDLIESAWGNATASHVTHRFPNKAALDTFAAPRGTLAVTTDQNVIWIRGDTIWNPTPAGHRISFMVLGGPPGQATTDGLLTMATWATELSDPSSVVAGGEFWLPAGWAGRWQFDWAVLFPAGIGTRTVYLSAGGRKYGTTNVMQNPDYVTTEMAGSASVVLAEGAKASISIRQTGISAPAAVNYSVDSYFQGYYAGPA